MNKVKKSKINCIKNGIENRIKTFDFHVCFEFSMRTMGHQNTKFNFQFWFEFAIRSMSQRKKTFDFQYCFKFAMITSGPSCGPVFS